MSLAEQVRWRIGGPASRFGRVSDLVELRDALSGLEGGPLLVLGWGANLLVADRGVRAAVLVLDGAFDWIRIDDSCLEAGAGAGLPALVGEARRAGAEGWCFLEAVPGTIGGGLRMNAGSADTGLWDRVIEVEAIAADGNSHRVTRKEVDASYRHVDLPADWVFTAARFELTPGDPEAVGAAHFERRRRKVTTQVYDLPSCGSVWKNPGPGSGSAWELVDAVGMRGASSGGARVAERHANFIANEGNARADDVMRLMRETRRRVLDQFGIALEPEIRFWGFDQEELASVGAAA
ncbi:MAG: UDP-N-acetylmuramate dehydrogenase [marine benthic group bacterium]|nr:UDP-N-acetylmuramate dehydrogenase [Gemmatimonadota bacterium]